ncbi:hypothetical protein [Kitasatospora sp. NPDC057500]|uniref:hypothetical protein n=1 Tax=Kitasatospora sp. NPDC057500 TaxID=3346151 RepID=UPI0036B12AF7
MAANPPDPGPTHPGRLRPVAAWALDGRPPRGVPGAFGEPCARVGRDLLRAPGSGVPPTGLRWDLSVDTPSGFMLGLATGTLRFALPADPALPSGQLTAWVAEIVQDHLAGYEFFQWPACPGHPHLLKPVLTAGEARWCCPADGHERGPIGGLAAG